MNVLISNNKWLYEISIVDVTMIWDDFIIDNPMYIYIYRHIITLSYSLEAVEKWIVQTLEIV